VKPAVIERNADFVRQEAAQQAAAGASYIDVNAGALTEGEAEALCWLVETVQSEVDLPCSLDSPRASAIEAALQVHKGTPLVNSVTCTDEATGTLLPLVAKYKAKAIALCMTERIPDTVAERVAVMNDLVDRFHAAGVPDEDILVDPCILGIGTWDGMTGEHPGVIAFETMKAARARSPKLHITAGLSNVSFGLPQRKLVNRAACVAFIAAGMDAAILDPMDAELVSLILAAEAVLNRDEFCMNYLAAAKAEKLVF
jgi:5-methyltetrahydrofolate--homocysteine methyltransferase